MPAYGVPPRSRALYPLDDRPLGWAIIYNESGVSPGRRRFTVSHEFGHYLLHRKKLPQGIECDEQVVTRREGKGIEKEADEFAAGLLMPLDDFRARIGADDKPSLDDLSAAADRYGASLSGAVLRWLEYTAASLCSSRSSLPRLGHYACSPAPTRTRARAHASQDSTGVATDEVGQRRADAKRTAHVLFDASTVDNDERPQRSRRLTAHVKFVHDDRLIVSAQFDAEAEIVIERRHSPTSPGAATALRALIDTSIVRVSSGRSIRAEARAWHPLPLPRL